MEDCERFKMDVLDFFLRSLGLVILECSICFLLNIGSLVGNGMFCVVVYCNLRFRFMINLYIIVLFVGDFICVVFEMLFIFWILVVGRWVFGDGMC